MGRRTTSRAALCLGFLLLTAAGPTPSSRTMLASRPFRTTRRWPPMFNRSRTRNPRLRAKRRAHGVHQHERDHRGRRPRRLRRQGARVRDHRQPDPRRQCSGPSALPHPGGARAGAAAERRAGPHPHRQTGRWHRGSRCSRDRRTSKSAGRTGRSSSSTPSHRNQSGDQDMFKRILATIVLALAATATLGSELAHAQVGAKDRPLDLGLIGGVVVDRDNRPIANATVSLSRVIADASECSLRLYGPGARMNRSVTTSSNGVFLIASSGSQDSWVACWADPPPGVS